MAIISQTPIPCDYYSRPPDDFLLNVAVEGFEGDVDASHFFDLFTIPLSTVVTGQTYTLTPLPLPSGRQ